MLAPVALVAAGILAITAISSGDDGPPKAAAESQDASNRLDNVVFPTSTSSTTTSAPPEALASDASTPIGTVSNEEVEAAFAQLEEVEVVTEFVGFDDYDRDDYTGGGWPDSDGDCQSDRHEILIEESLEEPTLDAEGCRVISGLWIDAYDGTEYTSADEVTIDHFIPLAAAHRAGGWEWDIEQKRTFSSDISFPATHAVVGGDVNQSKGDRGPVDWRPPLESAWCGYAVDWVAVKARWDLAFTQAEVAAIEEMLNTCNPDG